MPTYTLGQLGRQHIISENPDALLKEELTRLEKGLLNSKEVAEVALTAHAELTKFKEINKVWKPTKGWRRYGSLREVGDVLSQTAPNIAYHIKQNHKIYTQNIRHFEGGWYLLSVNQNKIKESLKKQ